jgi:hypothetical protein
MKILIYIILTITLSSCSMGAGTHGSINRYQYSVTKYELEKAVKKVLTISNTVKYDKSDSIDAFDENATYLKIIISQFDGNYKYTFRYYGDSLEWKNSANSELFIAYAYDTKGNGGHEGESALNKVKLKLIEIFEVEFISKIDSTLNIKHRANQ